ncbi:hypothetical protein Dsin_032674 [Dipteronia sinensis]|uniref:Uncharacterized protein n=1 Tax=Dipteronia sinensis TaxID=43782 RepID=A0AAE0DL44_9ROSI|nr:hypothetical protein Dsin_032674 [Dipteronia sinensis]
MIVYMSDIDECAAHTNICRVLGQGGQGAVYKGMLEDGRIITVIKLGEKEDILTIANLAKRCLNLNGKQRPNMKEVAPVLEGVRASQNDSSFQKNYEEYEYITTKVIEPWDDVSTSIGSTSDNIGASVDIQPLLTNMSS